MIWKMLWDVLRVSGTQRLDFDISHFGLANVDNADTHPTGNGVDL
jgi:hypothetical protein